MIWRRGPSISRVTSWCGRYYEFQNIFKMFSENSVVIWIADQNTGNGLNKESATHILIDQKSKSLKIPPHIYNFGGPCGHIPLKKIWIRHWIVIPGLLFVLQCSHKIPAADQNLNYLIRSLQRCILFGWKLLSINIQRTDDFYTNKRQHNP